MAGGSPLSVEGVVGVGNPPLKVRAYTNVPFLLSWSLSLIDCPVLVHLELEVLLSVFARIAKLAKSHAENKIGGFETWESYYFISPDAGAVTVFSEPHVRKTQVPMESWDEWKNKM